MSLEEIHKEVEKLKQAGEECDLQWIETEAGRVAEWQEGYRIENDPQEKEKWFKREQFLADERWRRREMIRARQGRNLISPISGDMDDAEEIPNS